MSSKGIDEKSCLVRSPIEFDGATARTELLPDQLDNYVRDSQEWIVAALGLSRVDRDTRDGELQEQVTDALGRIVTEVDGITNASTLSDSGPWAASELLHVQAQALYALYSLLQNPDDLDRCIHILETLPSLCDPDDSKTLNDISDFLIMCLSQRDGPREYGLLIVGSGLSAFCRTIGLPPDFVDTIVNALKVADELCNTSSEVRNLGHQAQCIEGLDQCISTIDRAVQYYLPDDQDLEPLSSLLVIQGRALDFRFELSGDTTDLDRTTFVLEIASCICDPGFSHFTSLSHFLVETLHKHYQVTDNPQSLDRAIDLGENLLSQSADETLPRIHASALSHRSYQGRNASDGDRAIKLCKEWLPLAGGEERLRWLRIWVITLVQLSRFGEKFPDVEQELQLLREGDLDLIVNSSPDGKQTLLEMIAEFLWRQLKIAAIAGDEKAVELAFREIHTRGFTQNEIAMDAMFADDDNDEISRAIEKLEQMYALLSPCDSSKPFALVLAHALDQRNMIEPNPQDVREARFYRSSLGPPGIYGRRATLEGTDTAEMLKEQIVVLTRNVPDAIWKDQDLFATAVPQWPDGRDTGNLKYVIVNQIAESLNGALRPEALADIDPFVRYPTTKSDSDFHTAQQKYLRLSHSAPDPRTRSGALQALAELHSARYEIHGKVEDLEQELNYLGQAFHELGDDIGAPGALDLRAEWADRVCGLQTLTPTVQHPDLLEALRYLRLAACSSRFQYPQRLEFARIWIHHTSKTLESLETQEHAFEMCELALDLVEERSWLASGLRSSLNDRYEMRSIGETLMRLASLAGLHMENVGKIVEIFDATQALVWGRLQQLRAPPNELAIVDPGLASRLQRSSNSLESHWVSNPESGAGPVGRELHNWQLRQKRNQIIQEVRELPGFEGFLARKSFDELRLAAMDGPVVTFALPANNFGFAIILHRENIRLAPISLTRVALERLHTSLGWVAGSRGTGDFPEEFDSGHADPSLIGVSSDAQENPRAGGPRRKGMASMEEILEVLWSRVVEPVVNAIMGESVDDGGEMKVVPKPEDRQRIWWFCTGVWSFMPIHAAGIYEGDSPICVSDFFISSYTPTLSALIEARKRPVPPELKVLVATQSNPGGKWRKLLSVNEELEEITRSIPQHNLLSLGDTCQPDLDRCSTSASDQRNPGKVAAQPARSGDLGDAAKLLDFGGRDTSVANVVKALPEATILHLACHGTQDRTNPLDSGFILANAEILTIEKLMKLQLPNAHTAILSACYTASNDEKQPDEGMNLASALFFLGFSSILATKWPMNDSDGPLVAKEVYRALFNSPQAPASGESQSRDPSPDHEKESVASVATDIPEGRSLLASFSLAKVVDDIVRDFRLVKRVPAEQWATFVHIGI